MTGNSPPPGWYTDGQGGQRWWDGNQWYEAAEPRIDKTQVDNESANAEPQEHVEEPSAEADSKRPSGQTPPATGVLGLVVAIAGLLVVAIAAVLLVMVNPDCLNNEECGQLSQSIWELFGLKSALLIVGLVLVVAGVLLRRRARQSAGLTRASVRSTRPEAVVAAVRRKRIWIPVVAVACLALAAGSWAVATAGPSDEERRIAAEKRESAAAERAESEAEAELALQKETCESTISEFKEAVNAVDSKLNVGLVQNDFNTALGEAQVAYDQLDADAILSDDYCVSDVLGPLEDAFNIYVKSNTKWNKCNQNYSCEVKGKVLDDLQARWLRATLKVAEADQALEDYGSTTAS